MPRKTENQSETDFVCPRPNRRWRKHVLPAMVLSASFAVFAAESPLDSSSIALGSDLAMFQENPRFEGWPRGQAPVCAMSYIMPKARLFED